ncbi:SKI3 [Mytilus edulis]|uniref:SKI3 n=1 Tax=Mytilus edulis TaxID=6550 RepID=A0A8S3UNU2_MYTED|nr:SKI3 [Mytilus edulis]
MTYHIKKVTYLRILSQNYLPLQTVLAQDKNNYNALVFVGVAADGMEHQELYKGDDDKKNDILSKLADIDVKIGAISMAIPIYENLVKEEKNEDKKEKYMYKLEEILRNEKSLSEEWKNLYISTCDSLFELDPVQFADTHLKTLERKDRVMTIPGSITSTVMVLQAEMLYEIGTDASLQSALEIIQQISDDVPTDLLKGQIYLKLNDLDNCEKCIHGESPEMIALSGCLLYHKNNYEDAVVKLKTSIETDPNNSWSMFWYAKALWEKYKCSKEN